MADNGEQARLKPMLLKDLVKQVKSELLELAQENEAAGLPTVFSVEKVTLEVNFAVEREELIGGKVGAKLIVLDLGAKASHKERQEQVHKVTLELSAHAPRVDKKPELPATLAEVRAAAIRKMDGIDGLHLAKILDKEESGSPSTLNFDGPASEIGSGIHFTEPPGGLDRT